MNFTKGFLKSLCLVFIVGLFNLFLCSHDAGALGLVPGDNLYITGGYARSGGLYDTEVQHQLQYSGNDWYTEFNPSSDMTALVFNVTPNIPGNAIVSFNVTYTYSNSGNPFIKYYGINFDDGRTLLYDSCSNINGTASADVDNRLSFTCTYVYFNPYSTDIIGTIPKSRIIGPLYGASSASLQVMIGHLGYMNTTNNGLSDDDRVFLQRLLEENSGDIAQVVNEIQRTNTILEEQQEQDEQDRSDLEQQTSDTEDSADQLQSDVESATSSISANISSIVGAFSTGPTDCIISITSGPNGVFTMNSMNLCQVPNEMHQLIHNILSIIVTISVFWTSFSLLSQFLSIYENYLGAGGIRH